MKFSTTLALLATSVALWGAIWWINRDAEADQAGSGDYYAGAALLRLAPDAVDRLVITHPGGKSTAEKRDGYWHFIEPVEDRIDPGSIDGLLDLLSHLTVLDQVPAAELEGNGELSAEALGLTGDQAIRVELISGGSTLGDSEASTQVVVLGKPTPLANTLYAWAPENEDRPDAYVVDGNPRDLLEDPVATLRDRHLFLAPTEQIVQVTVKTPLDDIEITRKITPPETDWVLTRPLESRANREQVDQLLATLSSLRVDGVTSTGDLPGELPSSLPEGALAIELRRYGVETPLTIFLRPAREQPEDAKTRGTLIEATVSDRPAVFTLQSKLLETLPSTTKALRDPHLARIPIQSVFGIAITSRRDPPVILKTARAQNKVAWYSTRNGKEEPANVGQVIEMIQAINDEQVIDFVSDSNTELATYNLDPPALRIAVSHYERIPETAPDGAPAGGGGTLGTTKKVLQLGFQQIEGDAEGRYRMFANFLGEPFIYEISPAFREKFPTHPLKWKDLKILSFNPISLRSIKRQVGDDPAVALTYHYRTNTWEATEGDSTEDIASTLNRDAARKLLDTLGSLTATTWMIPSAQAYQALENPDTTFEVTLETVDRATGSAQEVTHELQLAKASADIYFGRLDELQEVFVIDRETYRDLIMPIFGDLVRPPQN